MARGTPLLLPPTLDEIKSTASAIGLPEREAIRFFNFYESKGWMVGKNKMTSFRGALENWKMGWEDRGRPGNNGFIATAPGPQPEKTSGMDKMIAQKEYERVIDRMRLIKSSYAEMQTWTRQDAAEFKRLLDRKKQLKSILGITL